MSSSSSSSDEAPPRKKVSKKRKRPWRAPFYSLTPEAARKRLYREKIAFREKLGYVNPQQQHPATENVPAATESSSPESDSSSWSECEVDDDHEQYSEDDSSEGDPDGDEIVNQEQSLCEPIEEESLCAKNFTHNTDPDAAEFVKTRLVEIATKHSLTQAPVKELLSVLRNFFPELPKDPRTLLGTPKIIHSRVVPPGSYVHIGVEQNLRLLIDQRGAAVDTTVALDVFVDGVAFHKISKKKSFWVILGRFAESRKVFSIGVYNGVTQPASFNDLVSEFVEEALRLTTAGITVDAVTYKIKMRNFIADSMAQSDVAYIKSPVGYYSCPFCHVRGVRISRRTTFADTCCLARSVYDYLARTYPRHHKNNEESLLFTALMKFPSASPIDYLHNVLLGVLKRLLLYIFGRSGARKTCGLLNAGELIQLMRHLGIINEYLPSEVHHDCGSIRDLNSYKGAGFRVFLLKVGPVVMKKIAHEGVYETFLHLYSAITILCDPEQCLKNNDLAKTLLQGFIDRCITLFGEKFVVSTVHRLIHLPDIVLQQQQPLDFFSSFPFESFISAIKKDIHGQRDVIQQIHNRRIESIKASRDYFTDMPEDSLGVKLGPPAKDSPGAFKFVRYNSFIIRANSKRDGFLLTDQKQIVWCVKIVHQPQSSSVDLHCKVLERRSSLFTRPVDAEKLNYYRCANNFESLTTSLVISLNDLERKLFYMPLDDNNVSCCFAPFRKFKI